MARLSPALSNSPSSRRYLFCAVLTALLWWLSLQSFGFFAFGWIALTPLLSVATSLHGSRARFWFGWKTGVLCFALINWWICPTIIKGGAVIGASPVMGALLGVLSVVLIALIHGLGIAIIALLWNPRASLFARAPLLLPVFIAICWWVFEAARSSGVLAHSWGALAFSQWSDVALLQSASLIGQHGLSALCVWFAASLALWMQREYSARVPSLWILPVIVFVGLHLWGAGRIWFYDWTRFDLMPQFAGTYRPRPKVLIVQTNISSLRKNGQGGESHFDQAERLTREYLATGGGKTDLIVWPETTLTLSDNGDALRHRARIEALMQSTSTPVLAGAQSLERDSLSNRAVLFQSGKAEQGSSKMRVVPFGERAPFGEIFPFLNQLAPEPPMRPAEKVAPLQMGEFSIGTLICFESCFPDPARSLRQQGAQVLFVLTNDEWCAGTTAPWEHAAMSALRAVENDVPVIQSANGGYSFMVDARGRFLQLSDFGKAQTLAATLPLR